MSKTISLMCKTNTNNLPTTEDSNRLTAEEEKVLAERLFHNGDLDAANKLILSQLRFVAYIAHGYLGYGLPQADLTQEGNIGLMKAVKRFDPSVGVRLTTFAIHWIKAEIHEYVIRNWRTVKIATTKAQRKLFFNLHKSKKHIGWLKQTEVETIAKDLNVNTKDVLDMESRLSASDLSFELKDDDETYTPALYLEDKTANVAESVEKENSQLCLKNKLHSELAMLDERSQDIVRSRWLGDLKLTLCDLASRHGISHERVRQIEKAALKKLQENINTDQMRVVFQA